MLTDSGEDSSDCASTRSNGPTNFFKTYATGWIKAKGLIFERNSPETGSTLSTSPSISNAFFESMCPEMCVDLMRHSSPRIYKNIRRRIANADNEWMEGFFRADGLHVLFETLEELTDRRHFADSASLTDVLLPLYCVECVKAVMKNNQSIEQILNYPDCAYKLVQAIGSEKLAVRSNAVQLLSALAYYSERGCSATLEALQKYQKKTSKTYWVEILIDELKTNDVDYKASLMALINCIMFNVEFERRVKIRTELLAVGLKDLLPELTAQATSSERLTIQLGLFNDCCKKDEQFFQSSTVGRDFLYNSNDHYDLVKSILAKVDKTPRSLKFLTILQSLSLLDSETVCCDEQWNLIEHFLTTVSSMDSSDPRCLIFLLEAEKRLKNLFHDNKDELTQTSQLLGTVDRKKTSAKSSNKFRRRLSALLGVTRGRSSSGGDSTPAEMANAQTDGCHFNSPLRFRKSMKKSTSVSSSNRSTPVLSKKRGKMKRPFSKVKTRLMKHTATCISQNLKKEAAENHSDENEIDFYEQENRDPHGKLDRHFISKRYRSFSTLLNNGSCALISCKKVTNDEPDGEFLPKNFIRKSSDPTSDRTACIVDDIFQNIKTNNENPDKIRNKEQVLNENDGKDNALSKTDTAARKAKPSSPTDIPPAPSLPAIFSNLNKKGQTSSGSIKPSVEDVLESPKKNSPVDFLPPPPPPPPPPDLPKTLTLSRSTLALDSKKPAPVGHIFCSTAPNSAQPSPMIPLPPEFLLVSSLNKSTSTNSVNTLNERFYTFPIQKCKKTKNIYWNKVAPSFLKQKQNNLWAESSDFPVDQLNLPQIEEMFSCEPAATRLDKSFQATSSPKFSHLGVSSAVKGLDQVYFLDQKTSLKISLFLKQFRGINFEDIVQTVVDNQEDDQLSLERLRGLQRCLSGTEQYISDVQNYDGDYNKLGLAEKFLWHVSRHSFFCLRLEVACLRREFEDKRRNYSDSFDTLIDCCNSLRNSVSLKKFLYVTLSVGNYLNLGSPSGAAAGFKISSVKQLYGLKATNENSLTLLHIIVENAERIDENNALDFTRELSGVHGAAKIDFETAKTEAFVWAAEVDKLAEMVGNTFDNAFVEKTMPFLQEAKNSLKELIQNKIRQVEQAAKLLQDYFCDDLKLIDLLALFSQFLRSVEQAKHDNGQRKLKKERNEKQRQLHEVKKGIDLNSKRTAATDENLVEHLLMKICEGSISPKTGGGGNASFSLNGDQKSRNNIPPVQQNRHFVKSVITEQNRERTTLTSILR